MEDLDCVCRLLLSLPKSYEAVVAALETLDQQKLTLDFLKSRLIDEYNKRKNQNCATSSRDDSTAFGPSKVKFKYNCYNCGKPEHKLSECRFKTEGHWKKQHKPKRYQSANICEQEENKNQDYISFNASSKKSQVVNNEERDTITWILDSGASEHMVNRLEYFYKLEDLEIPVQITIAKDGEHLIAKKCGYIKMYAENGRIIKVDKVLYVPNLKCNLMSVSKLEKHGLKVN
ncbi:hypothetical protein ILUMI_01677 [Ignelater luminosus]|uniref:CCHC-type domain-containing protein n=1 Tax=Ignelater luminosus TaxID=2038154 RepID=A0A8K0DEV7_IGNLU|nr:hypothetical protein ILUMI_01677 [Ignelater luminosus]